MICTIKYDTCRQSSWIWLTFKLFNIGFYQSYHFSLSLHIHREYLLAFEISYILFTCYTRVYWFNFSRCAQHPKGSTENDSIRNASILACLSVYPSDILVFNIKIAILEMFWSNFVKDLILTKKRTLLKMAPIGRLFQPLPVWRRILKSRWVNNCIKQSGPGPLQQPTTTKEEQNKPKEKRKKHAHFSDRGTFGRYNSKPLSHWKYVKAWQPIMANNFASISELRESFKIKNLFRYDIGQARQSKLVDLCKTA